ncbi:tRNA glutamyl-Q(34) synthetase GluQRS [Pseudoroseomonas deserti]|uniref:tRNA glutamyl-Q(34) synthetase GluQRS n=1 Tax=Teichococcus deserti TaxID=1817963 RepID=A0A1V2H329_9PROT|nr:tRNA glutamyl-Q(34) synthetase GluQRS [Pseudoroseomonas deserti]ONG53229.1 tRNA glutamyl-Q(34) synthetase GluQRS [Pseudoroseomonas deserti]
MAATFVTRFAPSPTGQLHLGHAHSALLGWRAARQAGGRFLLRIEDIDPVRCRPEFTTGILQDLAWLGIDWDGPVRIQSGHLPDYRAVLEKLSGEGLLYPCFCTRADIAREVAAIGHAPHGPDGLLYPGTCRRLSAAERAERIEAGEAYALRLDMEAALARAKGPLAFLEHGRRLRCEPARFGDVVLARKDTPASYHLCVTHDDALQGVSCITRAVDLLPATDLHRLLQHLMGWPAPRYAHHPLRLGPDGKRLSKRDKAPTLAALREAGHSPEAVRAMAAAPQAAAGV